jgi:hypothetical protein
MNPNTVDNRSVLYQRIPKHCHHLVLMTYGAKVLQVLCRNIGEGYGQNPFRVRSLFQ